VGQELKHDRPAHNTLRAGLSPYLVNKPYDLVRIDQIRPELKSHATEVNSKIFGPFPLPL
jgi:hypothetical protein